jgi:uncharacterized membrane protein YgdD (TMEM256/DUF423 family)
MMNDESKRAESACARPAIHHSAFRIHHWIASKTMSRMWIIWAAAHGFISVACGAFAAHGLKGKISERMLANFETGARYEMYHALALLAVAWLTTRSTSNLVGAAGWCFAIGTCVFSFSLYALALTEITKLGAITPIGGVAMLAGWLLLAIAAAKAPTG